jgi:hypothetical protein
MGVKTAAIFLQAEIGGVFSRFEFGFSAKIFTPADPWNP